MVRILLPPAVSPLRTSPHSGRGRISTGMPARVWVKDIKVGFSNVNEGRGYRRPLSASFWHRLVMPVIQAAVVASRSKDPTGCWGPTFLSKLDMDAPVVGFTVLDII